jgi:LysM repeat protein
MFQTNTINSSKVFGSRVLRNLRRVNYVKYATVQEAPFIVLKLPEIPSVLVETAFISNPQEEKLLKSNRFQADIAKSLAAAITDFLSAEPLMQPSTPKIILTKETKSKSSETSDKSSLSKARSAIYKVEKGDTLEKIADKFNTRISILLKMNNMDIDDPLYFGRSLKVPAQEKDVAEKKKSEEVKTSTAPSETPPAAPAPQIIVHKEKEDDEDVESSPVDTKPPLSKPITSVKVYKVKRGDSLDKIAKRHNTTIGALLKLNKIKLKESLYVGKNIKVPKQDKEIAEKKKDGLVKASPTVSSSSKPEPVVSTYTVKKGDTVEKIAGKHNTTISALLKLNNMKIKDPLYFGRKLKVPGTEKKKVEAKKTVSVKAKVHTYRVKKGDTLDKIAQKYKTSISELRALNKMKRSDVLYVDQKLKLPSNSTL